MFLTHLFYVCMCEGVHVPPCARGGQQTTWGSQLFSSVTGSQGLSLGEFRIELMAGTFTDWVISLVHPPLSHLFKAPLTTLLHRNYASNTETLGYSKYLQQTLTTELTRAVWGLPPRVFCVLRDLALRLALKKSKGRLVHQSGGFHGQYVC